jgi:hypothetical protein
LKTDQPFGLHYASFRLEDDVTEIGSYRLLGG